MERSRRIAVYLASAWALYHDALMSTHGFSSEQNEDIEIEQGGLCDLCGLPTDSMQSHHKQMRSRGGANTRNNQVGLCPPCHHKVDDLTRRLHMTYEQAIAYLRNDTPPWVSEDK